MKKTYINPEMEVVEIHTPVLLTGSTLDVFNGGSDDTANPGDVLSPEMSEFFVFVNQVEQ